MLADVTLAHTIIVLMSRGILIFWLTWSSKKTQMCTLRNGSISNTETKERAIVLINQHVYMSFDDLGHMMPSKVPKTILQGLPPKQNLESRHFWGDNFRRWVENRPIWGGGVKWKTVKAHLAGPKNGLHRRCIWIVYVSVDLVFLDFPFLKASNLFISHIALFTFFPVIVSYKVICLFHDISLNARLMHWTELNCTFWLLVSFFSRSFCKHVCSHLISKSPIYFFPQS